MEYTPESARHVTWHVVPVIIYAKRIQPNSRAHYRNSQSLFSPLLLCCRFSHPHYCMQLATSSTRVTAQKRARKGKGFHNQTASYWQELRLAAVANRPCWVPWGGRVGAQRVSAPTNGDSLSAPAAARNMLHRSPEHDFHTPRRQTHSHVLTLSHNTATQTRHGTKHNTLAQLRRWFEPLTTTRMFQRTRAKRRQCPHGCKLILLISWSALFAEEISLAGGKIEN